MSRHYLHNTTKTYFLIMQHYLLTPWCRILLEKLTVLQLVKKLSAFYGTRRFITALKSVRHLSLSWASPIQPIYPHPTSCRSILILFTHLRRGLPSGLFPFGFPTKTLYAPLSSPIRATCPAHLILTYLLTPWCRVLLEKLTGLRLVKKFPTFYQTRRFITALTSVGHLSLSWASPIQSIYPHPTSVLILSTHLRLGLPSGSFPPVSPPRPYTPPSPHPYAPHAQPISFFSMYLYLYKTNSYYVTAFMRLQSTDRALSLQLSWYRHFQKV